ncbi:hypothetical protein WJX81_002724 [Elliptochloris bilobata]|uniref:Serine aminopeptidase S33 domain-containing protein n=1 Tax=Elliptochloris bilobata TaxID=381761 RepID=A0AAW1RME3_9CHLO
MSLSFNARIKERQQSAPQGPRLHNSGPEAAEVQEPAALEMLRAMQVAPIAVPAMGADVQTAYVTNAEEGGTARGPPLLLLHGFDSSLLEFRRLFPRLVDGGAETWAVDLAGWGFTDCGFGQRMDAPLGPEQKREHLFAFWKAKVRRPMVLLGTSLGGAIAVDFALAHPEAVAALVLASPQCYTDGIGPMAAMPRPIARLGVAVLRTRGLRQLANWMAYYDKDRLATQDAMRIGRLHTHCPGWAAANVAFMRSGGYSVSARVKQVAQRTLLLWGRHDEIVDPRFSQRYLQDLRNCGLEWLEESGHCGHLEEPERMAQLVLDFAAEAQH